MVSRRIRSLNEVRLIANAIMTGSGVFATDERRYVGA